MLKLWSLGILNLFLFSKSTNLKLRVLIYFLGNEDFNDENDTQTNKKNKSDAPSSIKVIY